MLLVNADRSKSDCWSDWSVSVGNFRFAEDDITDDILVLFDKKWKRLDMIFSLPKLMSDKVLVCPLLIQIPETFADEYFNVLEIIFLLLPDVH